MKSKPEKLTVEDLRNINQNEDAAFKVTKAVNTTAYRVGDYTSVKKIDEEIMYNPVMTVTIVPRSKR